MPAKKGTMPPNAGKGRAPGSKNKMPLQIAETVSSALQYAGGHLQELERRRIEQELKDAADRAAEEEGVEPPDITPILAKMTPAEAYLMTQALNEPKTFMTLVAKLMPAKVEGEIHVFEGAALVDRLQQGRALAAKQLKGRKHDEQRVH
jgi:hypothetical protein